MQCRKAGQHDRGHYRDAAGRARGSHGASMKVAVFGAGGVGGFFGGKLARSGVDVCFTSRGAHLEALQASGLRVASVHGDFELAPVVATSDPAEAGPVDYVLVAVKCYHTGQVAAGLGPLLHENTAVISLQNGIDNEEKLAAAAGPGRSRAEQRTSSLRSRSPA